MDAFVQFMQLIIEFMKRDYNFYGFNFSFFDVFMFSILGTLISFLIGALLTARD